MRFPLRISPQDKPHDILTRNLYHPRMRKILRLLPSGLLAAAMLAGCGGAGSQTAGTPSLRIRCVSTSTTTNALTVTPKCATKTALGFTSRLALVSRTTTASSVTAKSRNPAVAVVASSASSNSFDVTPAGVGSTTVEVQDQQGDVVSEIIEVGAFDGSEAVERPETQ